jgi:acyl-CoA dehydrogenase
VVGLAVEYVTVDAGSPGMRLVRTIETLDEALFAGHSEIALEECVVGEEQVLGAVGHGFDGAQARLGPARMTHCMRWLGSARRAQDVALERAGRGAGWRSARRWETSEWSSRCCPTPGSTTRRAAQVCGACGISAADAPLARLFRKVRLFRVYDGPSETHRFAIARRAARSCRQPRTGVADG